MIALAGQLPLQTAVPMREQGFEAPDHFKPWRQRSQFFPTSDENLEQTH
ncbi:hypothetical protein [Mesorhizobium humile]|uniref:Uncharacterized protein n=1 Tax=Mesorhizobium humile TaxID=3072313 RepID=A0ABU4YLF5_9HYPH|nr:MULTISPECIES: hypothetical protein [unclassified Mesorhizobium]MDX8462239.1 hypothetical protein [Mesorhizobium sp. VK2D]MDX8487506.1 hypothetical protein [Mesorhizobium sp. VK2B]